MLNGHPIGKAFAEWKPISGPLGHGLRLQSVLRLAPECGMNRGGYLYLTGDGETPRRATNWEAAMTAQHYGLDKPDRHRRSESTSAGDFTENTLRMELWQSDGGLRFLRRGGRWPRSGGTSRALSHLYQLNRESPLSELPPTKSNVFSFAEIQAGMAPRRSYANSWLRPPELGWR